MKNPIHRLARILLAAGPLLPLSAHARLVAWYPLDDGPSAAATAPEVVAGNDANTIGFDPDPVFSFITRGHPSAHSHLGRSYLINKGGGFDLGGAEAVQPTDKFTISFWFQPLTFDAFDRFLESQVTNTNAQDGIRIDLGANPGNRVRVLVRDNNGTSNSQFTHPLALKNDGSWYFFAFRYDSEGLDNDPFRLTVVEATAGQIDEAAVSAGTAGPAAINTGPIHFPHAAVGTLIGVELPTAANANNLHAALDELAFFDNSDGEGVLTDQQLAEVYNFGPSRVQLISSFSSDRASVASGDPVTLSWEVTEPFDTLVLEDGLGNTTDLAPETTAGAGTFVVNPTDTTTYLLRAARGEAANVHTITILAGAPPEIMSFGASPSVIQVGGSVDLSWSVTGAETLTLDPGGTDITGLNTTNLSPTETTTYTLTATNQSGTSTAEVTVTVISGPLPVHRYVASSPGNDASRWIDEIGSRDWPLTGAFFDLPLFAPSPNTNLTAAYFTGGGPNGGGVASFQLPELTAEVWLRPGLLGPEYEVVFESGGGQNGFSILVNEDEFRFLGSAGDVRTLDLTILVAGLNLEDFVQVVFSNNAATDEVAVSVRDTFGNVRTASETTNVVIGGNGAGLFVWASGALGGSHNNLGGRTEAPDVSPPGLTGFAGEIAVLNIYDRILEPAEVELAFEAVATVVEPPAQTPIEITAIVHDAGNNTLTVTWTSVAGRSYDAQFSTNLDDWFDFEVEFEAMEDLTTETLNIPPNQDEFFVRIRELAEE